MTYAYRQTTDDRGQRRIDLFVSEVDKPAPAGYTSCDRTGFRAAWRERDTLRIEQLRATATPLVQP